MTMLKQSTAVTLLIGPFVDDGDGNTVEGGLTISQADVRLSMNGGNMAQKTDATACTHDELGYYTCPLDATDTGTLGILKVMVHESGALPVWHEYQIVPANTWDSLVGGTDYLNSETAAMAAGVVTAAAVATAAIDADAIATDAIGAAEIAADAIGASEIAAGAIAADAFAAGAIDAAAIANAAIDAATFAAGAIDAAATAADFIAEINAEMVDVFDTDVLAEPAQGAPPATPTKDEVLAYLYYALRNKGDATSAIKRFYANDEATVLWSKALTDDDTTYAEAEGISG
jgi:hypothetical protein